jgi:hypothetical protein
MTGMKGVEWVGRKPAIAKQIAASWRFQLRTEPCGSGLELSPIAFGSQTVSRGQGQDPRHMETHGFASLPRGRFAFIGVQSSDSIKIISV